MAKDEVSDREIVEGRDDARMILRPDLWPHPPALPLKRYVDEATGLDRMDVAVILSVELRSAGPLKVHKNMALFGALGEVEVLEYETVEDLLADGWMVD